jgi:hypothetical protein
MGCTPTTVRRFTTGARHYVFDVAFADRPAVVVRIGSPSARPEMAGAVHLSASLLPICSTVARSMSCRAR